MCICAASSTTVILTLSLSSTGGYASALFVFYDDKKINHSMSHASQSHANTMTPLDNDGGQIIETTVGKSESKVAQLIPPRMYLESDA